MADKFTKKCAVVFFVLTIFLTNCANAQIVPNNEQGKNESPTNNVDLSTDEAVIAELQKMADARNVERIKGDEKLEAKKRANKNPKMNNLESQLFTIYYSLFTNLQEIPVK